jgi:hypothetical protein
LSTPEGAIGNVDVDGERLVELVVEHGTQGSEDALESLNTSTEVETLLAALEERLLDLSVLLRRPLTHEVVEEVNGVDALGGPRGLAVEEGVETVEVHLTSEIDVDDMLVGAAAFLGRPALFGIKINVDASVITLHALARPEVC